MGNKMGEKVSWGIFPRRQTGKLVEKRKFTSLVLLKSGAVKSFQNRILTFEWTPFKRRKK